MAYTSQKDVERAAGGEDALVALTDQDNDGEVDATVLAEAQAEADGWINSYARRQYTVPFSPVPPAIRKMAALETVYRLKQWRHMVSEQDLDLHRERELELRSINDGLVMPVEETYPIRNGGGTPVAVSERADAEVSRETLKGFW